MGAGRHGGRSLLGGADGAGRHDLRGAYAGFTGGGLTGWGDEHWRGWGFEATVPYDASLCADGDHSLCCARA